MSRFSHALIPPNGFHGVAGKSLNICSDCHKPLIRMQNIHKEGGKGGAGAVTWERGHSPPGIAALGGEIGQIQLETGVRPLDGGAGAHPTVEHPLGSCLMGNSEQRGGEASRGLGGALPRGHHLSHFPVLIAL